MRFTRYLLAFDTLYYVFVTIQYVLLWGVLCLLSARFYYVFLNIAKTVIYCHVLRARFKYVFKTATYVTQLLLI